MTARNGRGWDLVADREWKVNLRMMLREWFVDLIRRLRDVVSRESPSLLAYFTLIGAALGLVSAPILARSLGTEGRGVTAAALAAFNLVPVLLSFGVPLEARRLAVTNGAASVVRGCRRVSALTAIPAAACAWVINEWIFSREPPNVQIAVLVGISLAPLTVGWALDMNVLLALGRYRAAGVVRIVSSGAVVGLLLIAWTCGFLSVEGALVCNILGSVLTWVLCLALLKVSWRGEHYSILRLGRDGSRYFGSTLADAASSRLDQLLVLPLMGSHAAGLYSVASTIGIILPLSVGQGLGIASFRRMASPGGEEGRSISCDAVHGAASVAVVTSGALAASMPVVVPLVFGSDFVDAVPAAVLMCVSSGVGMTAYVVSMLLAASGRGLYMTMSQSLSLAVRVVVLVSVGPIMGAIGGAVAAMLAYGILLIALMAGSLATFNSLVPTPRGLRSGLESLRNSS